MKNELKPDIDFEQELWKAANKLRGALFCYIFSLTLFSVIDN